MSKPRPQMSITLPRNFAFHYTEGELPKTPERQTEPPQPPVSQAEAPFRVKRRPRPTVFSLHSTADAPSVIADQDTPRQSIEFPASINPRRPALKQSASDTITGWATVTGCMRLPHTPEPQPNHSTNRWTSRQDVGEAISRPLSACSISTNSSDDSTGSLTSYPAGDGSCTSPESEVSDPFRHMSYRNSKPSFRPRLPYTFINSSFQTPERPSIPKWTPDMDRHLWSTYLSYLQDPTVTPFKMLPGTAPPLGVCHRVAREASKTWRIGRPQVREPAAVTTHFSLQGQPNTHTPLLPLVGEPLGDFRTSSDSCTSNESTSKASQPWPRSNSFTRRRLRLLCKRKPSIAPHYQRLLQSRSPSPFSSSSRSISRSQSRLSYLSSPAPHCQSSFNTREVQLSLSTSVADSMQPDGPLAQLATDESSIRQRGEALFDEPPAPFASEIPVPSDLGTGSDNDGSLDLNDALATPRLGSPCGFHTWGPDRSGQRSRSRAPGLLGSSAVTLGPSVLSPLQMRYNAPHPGINKRRAHHQWEDELSPCGSSVQHSSHDHVSRKPVADNHRRVRSRGFSLGDLQTQHPLQSLFSRPGTLDPASTPPPLSSPDEAIVPIRHSSPVGPSQRLNSPFQGISPRPARRGPRHLSTFSLGAHDRSTFSSISERLHHAPDAGNPESGD